MPHYHFEDQADDFGATVRLDRLNDKVREETERGATQEFHPVKPASSLQPSPREKVKPSGASGRSSVSMPGQFLESGDTGGRTGFFLHFCGGHGVYWRWAV